MWCSLGRSGRSVGSERTLRSKVFMLQRRAATSRQLSVRIQINTRQRHRPVDGVNRRTCRGTCVRGAPARRASPPRRWPVYDMHMCIAPARPEASHQASGACARTRTPVVWAGAYDVKRHERRQREPLRALAVHKVATQEAHARAALPLVLERHDTLPHHDLCVA